MEFHEILASLIKEKGVSQSQLCKMSGIATSAMSHYVRGESEPSFTKVIAIAKALDVPVDVLAGKNPQPAFDIAAITHRIDLAAQEEKLIALFRLMDEQGCSRLMEQAEFLAARHPKNQATEMGA